MVSAHTERDGEASSRFQRFEAWDRGRITSFLTTIINNLPVGVTLALEVEGLQRFVSRYVVTSDPATPGPVTQHLLDGQQRLTAFWRAIHNNYTWETFFVYLPQLDQSETKSASEVEIRCIPRWLNKNQVKMPRWADTPEQCLRRGLLPLSLLRPGDISNDIDCWLESATIPFQPSDDDPDALDKLRAYMAKREEIKAEITTLRERVTHFNLPYLSLPASTSKDVALQVFINMNTNSKPLSLYDIIVAEVEGVAEQSLHEMEAELRDKCPNAERYGDLSDLILSTSALLQERLPNRRGMIEMDKMQLLENWPKLERGLERMAVFLEGQGVFDAARLPTNAVLAVIAAAYEKIPEHGDFMAKAERLLRRYLWSAFFTDRYENTAATRAFADYRAIRNLVRNHNFTDSDLYNVPTLNRSEHALANVDSLMAARWPKSSGIVARAILAITARLGAIDFADHKPATYESIQTREYHHIFPDALLSEAEIDGTLALNCAFVTWKTNRLIGRKDPLDYLQERVEWADENIIRERLKSHLISFDLLTNAHYANLSGSSFRQNVSDDFAEFLKDRATLVVSAMKILVEGDTPSLEALWSAHNKATKGSLKVA